MDSTFVGPWGPPLGRGPSIGRGRCLVTLEIHLFLTCVTMPNVVTLAQTVSTYVVIPNFWGSWAPPTWVEHGQNNFTFASRL